ncbi:MAG: class I SAM-dependent methyltransferase [Rhodobacter sp.]|nr:class I SAM-dependent methyltransferase [Rhodobacter sp.]
MTAEQTQPSEVEDFDGLKLRYDSIDDRACALLGYQRTKQISRKSRISWEAGDSQPLFSEVKDRKEDIIQGAFLEIYQEYLPLKTALGPRKIETVCDVGCGQGINNLFLHRDFEPRFTLVDIEETDSQHHLWAEEGSGYASLQSAKSLLVENGCSEEMIETVNPRKASWKPPAKGFDLVTSLYSCGFHYPIDDYVDLFVTTIENGGAVCLDLRQRYLRRGSPALSKLLDSGKAIEVFEAVKSSRMLIQG